MADNPPPPARLTAESCLAKAEECRQLARYIRNPEQKIMLEHMAETWDRIAKTYGNGK